VPYTYYTRIREYICSSEKSGNNKMKRKRIGLRNIGLSLLSCDPEFHWGRPVGYGKTESFAFRRQ